MSIQGDIIRHGVLWHTCEGCGQPWPFPKGFHLDRQWRCHVCVQKDWAAQQREVLDVKAVIHRHSIDADGFIYVDGLKTGWMPPCVEHTPMSFNASQCSRCYRTIA